jgi:glycosyltransferase involved in cell wall biosynthesis
MPKVTVGVPTYKRAKYLRESIPQILGQTFKDFELVVCDDASPDNTGEVVSGFKDPRIRYYRNPENYNMPGNLNRILELATGEFIVVLHDHDIFHPELLGKMVRLLEENPSVGFVHPGVAWVNPDGSNYQEFLLDFEEVIEGHRLVEAVLLSDDFSCPVCACAMVTRKAYEKVGFFYDRQYGFISDIDLWLRLSMEFEVGYLREPLITCRRREETHVYSGVNWQMNQWAVSIHLTNMEKYYAGRPDMLERATRIWKKKRDAFYLRSLLTAAAQGDLPSFREGLGVVSRSNQGWQHRLAGRIGRASISHKPIVSLGAGLNRLRKIFI